MCLAVDTATKCLAIDTATSVPSRSGPVPEEVVAPRRARAYLWLGLEPVRTVSTDSTDSQYVRRSNPKALFLTHPLVIWV